MPKYAIPALAWAALALAFAPGSARAACDIDHKVQGGDTYYSIAQDYYGDRKAWRWVFEANQTANGAPALYPGNRIYIPCLPGAEISGVQPTVGIAAPAAAADAPLRQPAQEAPSAAPVSARVYPENPELKLLTGGNYPPFTDRNLPGEGLVTELVHAALDLTPSKVTYSVTWEDDWSQHLFPLLDEKKFDMGFPWLKPDCEATPDNPRCARFHFSDPVFTMPIMLFVRADNQFPFRDDSDIVGRSLCRPRGYFTHDLDRKGRRWISEEKITLVRGDSPRDCFERVLAGAVDAASVNLFLGGNVIVDMGLRNQIVPLERPVSEEGLHLVISKSHWRGTAMLYRVNAGLKRLRESGRYEEIVVRHLEMFQSRLK